MSTPDGPTGGFRPLMRRIVVPRRREPPLPPRIFLLTQVVAASFQARHDFNLGAGRFYHACKAVDGYPGDDGTFPLVASRVYKFYFQCDRAPFYEALSQWDQLQDVVYTRMLLEDGYAPDVALDHIGISFRIFDSTYSAPLGRLPLRQPGDRDRGLHAVAVIGWDFEEDVLVFQNSWGRWGDDGVGYMSREYFERYLNDAWLTRRAHVGPTPAKLSRIDATKSTRDLAAARMLRNPIWRAVPVQGPPPSDLSLRDHFPDGRPRGGD
jgi:hypothetical protein